MYPFGMCSPKPSSSSDMPISSRKLSASIFTVGCLCTKPLMGSAATIMMPTDANPDFGVRDPVHVQFPSSPVAPSHRRQPSHFDTPPPVDPTREREPGRNTLLGPSVNVGHVELSDAVG